MLKISASRSLGSGSVFSRRFLHGTRVVNAGHSKWANIKHTKAKNDAERTKIYNKIANQISVAVKLGGSADPAMNIRLATAIELANKNNVTKKVIENAIKKGSGTNDGASAGAEPVSYTHLDVYNRQILPSSVLENGTPKCSNSIIDFGASRVM